MLDNMVNEGGAGAGSIDDYNTSDDGGSNDDLWSKGRRSYSPLSRPTALIPLLVRASPRAAVLPLPTVSDLLAAVRAGASLDSMSLTPAVLGSMANRRGF